MRTVAQLTPALTPYIANASGRSYGTSVLAMLNRVLPELYSMGSWPALLKKDYEVDAISGYFFLPPDYSNVESATLDDEPMTINSLGYESKMGGPGNIKRTRHGVYGLIDSGYWPIKSEIAEAGADEFIFTCESASFASGDSVTVVYDDSTDGYVKTVLALNAYATTIAFTSAASGGTGLTSLVVANSADAVVGTGITISGAGVSSYNDTFRVSSVPDGTHVVIEKTFDSTTTGTIANARRIMPANTIAGVRSIEYTSLPGRTKMKDADGIEYADLLTGDGMAQFRRYEVPQVPETAEEEDWMILAVVKRAFIPLTATTEAVDLDNIPALTYAFQAVILADNGDPDEAEKYWLLAKRALEREQIDYKGGIQERPTTYVWGEGLPPLAGYY